MNPNYGYGPSYQDHINARRLDEKVTGPKIDRIHHYLELHRRGLLTGDETLELINQASA